MKQFFIKHWEKVALIASIGLLLVYVVFGVLRAKPNPLIAESNTTSSRLSRELASREVEMPSKPGASERVNLSYAAPAAAAPGQEVVFYRFPEIAVEMKLTRVDTPKLKPKAFKKPVLGAPALEVGSVKLAWGDDPENKNVDVAGYLVYRRAPGSQDFEKITPEAIKEKTFTDASVLPKKEYQYVVGAVTADKEAIERLKLDASGEVKSDPQSVTTLPIVDLELRGVAELPPQPGEPAVPTAQITVKKFIGGKWKTKLILVRKGDRIGEGDLATSFEVLDLARVNVKKVEEYIDKKFNDKGEVIGEEKRQRTREIPTWELKYRDDEGKAQILHPTIATPPKPGPTPGVTPKPGTPPPPGVAPPKPPAGAAPPPPIPPKPAGAAPAPPKAP
jgi:hypothetical protein